MAEYEYGLEINYQRSLAFVFRDDDSSPAAAVEAERNGALLPRVELGVLLERAKVGSELFTVYCVSARELCRWINAARDGGAVLTLGPEALERWWLDGVYRVYPVDLQRVGLRETAAVKG
jgi:hypothetical protein